MSQSTNPKPDTPPTVNEHTKLTPRERIETLRKEAADHARDAALAKEGRDEARKEAATNARVADMAKKDREQAREEAARLRQEMAELIEAAKLPQPEVRDVASPAQMRKRHYGLIVSFAVLVLAPAGLAAGYLYTRAVDQYASTMAFTVRTEDITSSAADLLGGLGAGFGGSGGSAGSDADILYEFMKSPDLVRRIDDRLDLHALYGRYYDTDPVFSFDVKGTIEDLTDYWTRMVRVSYDSSRLMEVRTLAFTPEDARAIAEAVFAESSTMVNALSEIARNDSTRYAAEDLETATVRLTNAREALTLFRLANEIVDPQADIQSQMGLLSSLQAQQTEALISLDLLGDSIGPGDPRREQAQRRLQVIEERIAEERQKFGAGGEGPGGETYAATIANFERLSIEREFAERTYASALSAFDNAKAEATRQSRYLAAYIKPTLAEQAEYPQRARLVGMVAMFAFLTWVIGALIYYSLRERR